MPPRRPAGMLNRLTVLPIRQVDGWYDGCWGMTRKKKTGLGAEWALATDQLVLIPFWSPWDDWDEIGVHVATAEAGKGLKLAIYEMGSDGLPGAVIWSSTEIDLSTTGEKTIALGAQPAPGWWYMAFNSDATSAELVSCEGFITPLPPTTVQGEPGDHYTKAAVTYSGTPFPASPSGLALATGTNDLAWIKTRITS